MFGLTGPRSPNISSTNATGLKSAWPWIYEISFNLGREDIYQKKVLDFA